jgi:hypothetical protein
MPDAGAPIGALPLHGHDDTIAQVVLDRACRNAASVFVIVDVLSCGQPTLALLLGSTALPLILIR